MARHSNEEMEKLKVILIKAFKHFKVIPKQSIETITYNYEVQTYSLDIRTQIAQEKINFN